jgi:FKBP-type peptidyl-prolyl cis-trans isomerase 2
VEAALLQMREGAQCELRVAPDWASVRHTETNAKKKYPAGWLLNSYKGPLELAEIKSVAANHVAGKLNGGGYTHTSQEKLLVKLELESFTEVVDASNDGGVLVEVQSEGEGQETPSMYDICYVKFSLHDEAEGQEATAEQPADVFESSDGEGGLELGSGNMCVGLELALMQMKKGAKAKLRIHPAYSRYTPVGDGWFAGTCQMCDASCPVPFKTGQSDGCKGHGMSAEACAVACSASAECEAFHLYVAQMVYKWFWNKFCPNLDMSRLSS